MRTYSEFSLNLMIMLRDERTLEECVTMLKAFKAEPELLDEDTMTVIFTELEKAIKEKTK